MSYEPMRKLQDALRRHGIDPGPVDGVYGPKTRRGIENYQERHEHPLGTGVPTANTIRALLGAHAPRQYPELMAPWLCILLAYKNLHEVNDNRRLSRWLRSDGKTLGDPARSPWCGDAVQTAIALALPDAPIPSNPYLAKNWGKFGQGLTAEPPVGAILDFWRGSPSSLFGHVGFCMGHTPTHYIVAGGNQRNRITDNARIEKRRLRAIRWPLGVPVNSMPREMSADGSILSWNEA